MGLRPEWCHPSCHLQTRLNLPKAAAPWLQNEFNRNAEKLGFKTGLEIPASPMRLQTPNDSKNKSCGGASRRVAPFIIDLCLGFSLTIHLGYPQFLEIPIDGNPPLQHPGAMILWQVCCWRKKTAQRTGGTPMTSWKPHHVTPSHPFQTMGCSMILTEKTIQLCG